MWRITEDRWMKIWTTKRRNGSDLKSRIKIEITADMEDSINDFVLENQ